MYRTINFRLPARRSAAAVGAAAALAAGAVTLAPAAQATPGTDRSAGTSTATVLRTALDVSLLGRAVDLPVNLSLNDVKAPADAKGTALSVKVGSGVEGGRRIDILRADAATANATADQHKAEGYANVVHAEVHLPGLPLLALVKVDALSSKATCEAGRKPTASSRLAGVTVLGRRVSLTAVGATQLAVPGVGEVSVDLTRTVRTSDAAAATALRLQVHVNPLSLGVADVSGTVTLAQATCRTPHRSGGSTSGGTGSGGSTSGATNGGSTSGGTTTGGPSNGGASGGGSTAGGATSGGSTSGGASNGGATNGGSASGGSTGGTPGASGSGGTSGSSGTSGTPGSGTSGTSGTGGPGSGGTAPGTRTVADGGHLAETGASSSTPYLAVGAAGLVAAGAAAYLVTARRRKGAGEGAPQD